MKIKNTDGTYCKIKDIKVSGIKAYITMIIYSSIPQTTEDNLGRISRVFAFYLKDSKTNTEYKLSNNNYWIDRCNNYNNDSTNIDINMYKELILEIDISNQNNSEMLDNHWVRNCYILIKDQQNSAQEILWQSELLNLISKEIILPTIKNIHISTTREKELLLSFDEYFESQEDFNYNNDNLSTQVILKSSYTNKIVETQDNINIINNHADIVFLNTIDSPITIQINILNNKNQILYSIEKFYNPSIQHKVFIKQNNTFKPILNCSLKNKNIISITNK